MKKRAPEQLRTGIRVRHLEGRRANEEPIDELSNEVIEQQSFEVEVLPAPNVDTDKLRLRIFEGMQKSGQKREPSSQAESQSRQQQQPQVQHRMLGEYNRQTPPRMTVKIGEPVRLPDPLRLTTKEERQQTPLQPAQPNQQAPKPKAAIQMPNMHQQQQNNVPLDSLQNFLKQPPQLREQLLQQMNPQKGSEEPIKIKPLIVYGQPRQKSFEQSGAREQQTHQILPPNMNQQHQQQPRQELQPALQPPQQAPIPQQRVPNQQPFQQPINQTLPQRTPLVAQTPVHPQSIQEQLHHQTAFQAQQTNPQAKPETGTLPAGMLISLRDPQIKTQQASEEVDAELMKRVDCMQKQIEQLTTMLAEKDKREQLTDQRIDEVIRLKNTELAKKDADIAKHLLRIEELQEESAAKSKEIDTLKYQLARQKQHPNHIEHPSSTTRNVPVSRELDIRRQQQHLDELERSKGDSQVFEQSLFKRQRQPSQQPPKRHTSEFEVKWNSTDWNAPPTLQHEQEVYLSPLAVNMNSRRPLEIDDSKRFRFEDLQDMSQLQF